MERRTVETTVNEIEAYVDVVVAALQNILDSIDSKNRQELWNKVFGSKIVLQRAQKMIYELDKALQDEDVFNKDIKQDGQR